jgi:hypothetical protein
MTTGMEAERHEIEKQKAKALIKIAKELTNLRIMSQAELKNVYDFEWEFD